MSKKSISAKPDLEHYPSYSSVTNIQWDIFKDNLSFSGNTLWVNNKVLNTFIKAGSIEVV